MNRPRVQESLLVAKPAASPPVADAPAPVSPIKDSGSSTVVDDSLQDENMEESSRNRRRSTSIIVAVAVVTGAVLLLMGCFVAGLLYARWRRRYKQAHHAKLQVHNCCPIGSQHRSIRVAVIVSPGLPLTSSITVQHLWFAIAYKSVGRAAFSRNFVLQPNVLVRVCSPDR